MKSILPIAVFILAGLSSMAPAHAFYGQGDSFFYSGYLPYPPVISQGIDILPEGAVTITVGDETFYYCEGLFYQKIVRDGKYAVVPAPVGAVVFSIPSGYQYLSAGGISFYVYGGVYYRRVLEGYQVISPPV